MATYFLDSTETSLPQIAHIVGVTDENDRIRTLVLDRRMDAEPGQFLMAWLPGIDERPFSLVHPDPVTLMIARVGPFSTAVHKLKVGDPLWIRGPLGAPFRLPAGRSGADGARAGSLLLVGGGYGVAPLRFLADHAITQGWPVTVAIGARTATDVVYVERFAELGAHVVVVTDDGTAGWRGLATDAASQIMDEQDVQALYACGPEPMLEALRQLALARNVPAQLSYEGHMRCGMGVCGSCAQGGWLVCRDGPVKFVIRET